MTVEYIYGELLVLAISLIIGLIGSSFLFSDNKIVSDIGAIMAVSSLIILIILAVLITITCINGAIDYNIQNNITYQIKWLS